MNTIKTFLLILALCFTPSAWAISPIFGAGASFPGGGNLLLSDGTDSGIDPAIVFTTDNISAIDAHTIPLAAIDGTPVDLSTVLVGSTYTLVPNTIYFGTVTGSKTFAISPALTSADQGIVVRAHLAASSTQTFTSAVLREGADASVDHIDVAADGNYTLHFVDDGAGNVRLYDTVPQSLTDAEIPTNSKIKTVTFTFWNNGSALSTGNSTTPFTFPYAGTITGYSISADAGTATVKFWKKATGTAIPTISDVINTSGVALSSGTHVRSTTVTDFTTTAVAAGDMLQCAVTAVATATKLTVQLEVTP